MKKVKMLSVLAALVLAVSMCGCVDQHPDESSDAASSMEQTDEYKLAATSPAVVDICVISLTLILQEYALQV